MTPSIIFNFFGLLQLELGTGAYWHSDEANDPIPLV